MAEQNFENHGKFVPAFHFFVIPVAAINFGWQIYRWKAGEFTLAGFESMLLAAALLIGFLYARLFALRVQDRVIRLEERLRCQRLLPADLQPRIAEFTAGQMGALRFSSDAGRPAPRRKRVVGKLNKRKGNKKMGKKWKPG